MKYSAHSDFVTLGQRAIFTDKLEHSDPIFLMFTDAFIVRGSYFLCMPCVKTPTVPAAVDTKLWVRIQVSYFLSVNTTIQIAFCDKMGKYLAYLI